MLNIMTESVLKERNYPKSVVTSCKLSYDFLATIAKISVTSPIVIDIPTRELFAGETKGSFDESFEHLNNKKTRFLTTTFSIFKNGVSNCTTR